MERVAFIVLPSLALTGGSLSLDAATTVGLPPLSLASTGLSVRAGTGVSLPSAVNLVGSTLTLESPAVTFSALTLSGSSIVGATDVTVSGNLSVIGSSNSTIGGSGSFTTLGTTTVNLAAGLAQIGQRVLVVDLDTQVRAQRILTNTCALGHRQGDQGLAFGCAAQRRRQTVKRRGLEGAKALGMGAPGGGHKTLGRAQPGGAVDVGVQRYLRAL